MYPVLHSYRNSTSKHQVKDFQPLFICDLQIFSSEGDNPHTDNVSLLIITLLFSLAFHWPLGRSLQRTNLAPLAQIDLILKPVLLTLFFQAASYHLLQEHHPAQNHNSHPSSYHASAHPLYLSCQSRLITFNFKQNNHLFAVEFHTCTNCRWGLHDLHFLDEKPPNCCRWNQWTVLPHRQ